MNDIGKITRQKGFSLLEAFVTLSIVSFGMLSVTFLQNDLFSRSSDNKARAEAITLAQARIEELRNYTNRVSSRVEFDAFYADTAGYANDTTIEGVNADFLRQESISADGLVKNISARVSWTDQTNSLQNISLSTELSWQLPRAPGDIARDDTDPLVSSPSGRADLGEGILPDDAPTTPNDDGTRLYVDGNDLKLVDGQNIVLTLQDACDEGGCIDFVTVNGRVYIDSETQNNLNPGSVFVKASNKAYCARYYIDSNGDTVTVTNETSSTISTPGGDYEYFDYRCYMGGGWHGNIGILLSGGNGLNDKVCQGDPVTTDEWAKPVISARRIYRGMIYKKDDSTTSGKVEDELGIPIFWTIGTGDSVELGLDPVTEKPLHNFVVSSMQTNATTGDNCIDKEIMVRADSNVDGTPGDLFRNMQGDFYCLNPHADTYDASIFVLDDSCPFDPSGPPVNHYVISGTLEVSNQVPGGDANGITMNTSDGPGNCVLGDFIQGGSVHTAEYRCDVYDWSSGWNGYLQINSNSTDIACSVDRVYLDDVTSDSTGPVLECVDGHASVIRGSLAMERGTTLTSIEITDAATGQSGYCSFSDSSYSCVTNIYGFTDWSGLVRFNANGYVCNEGVNHSDGTVALNQLQPGQVTQLDVAINKRASSCR